MNFTFSERQLTVNSLEGAVRTFVSEGDEESKSCLLAFIDHSPSEQLGYEDHTSVIFISPPSQLRPLIDELTALIGPLRQWKSAGSKYKKLFFENIFHLIAKYPVLVAVFCAKEMDILKGEANFLIEVGADNSWRRFERSGKTYVEIGPISDNESREICFELTDRQAPMALFTAVIVNKLMGEIKREIDNRKHSSISISRKSGNNETKLFIYSDKPPGDFGGTYSKFLEALLFCSPNADCFAFGGFTGQDDVPEDVLTDNVVGLFREITTGKWEHQKDERGLIPPIRGVLTVQRFETK